MNLQGLAERTWLARVARRVPRVLAGGRNVTIEQRADQRGLRLVEPFSR